MAYFINTIDYKRECGTCSECCQGWLTGEIYEYQMSPNNPCHFCDQNSSTGGCQIYEHRPEMCSSYKCVWLAQPVAFPEWMKPEKSKVLISHRILEVEDSKEEIQYWQVRECGSQIDSTVLNWILTFHYHHHNNIMYQIAGQWYYLGSPEFVTLISRTIKDNPTT